MLHSSFPLAIVLHMVVYICQSYSPSLSHPFLTSHVHKSVLYVCISIPALQIDSSVPFFWIPDMCVNVYLLLSGLLHSVCIMITSQFLSKPGALSWLRYPAYSTFYLYVCWHVKALQNCPESNFGFPSFHL